MSRHIRWQAALALLGLLLIVALLSYAAYFYTSTDVPARGGVFIEGVAGNPRYINPVLCQYNEVDRDLCALVFSGLLRFDERGDLAPDLAESWEVNAASTVFTYTLRPDARWHDGLRVTADDVLFTVEMMQETDLPVLPDLATLWRSVIAAKIDDRTIVFQLSEPYAAFPDYTTIRWFGVLPKHYWSRYTTRDLINAQLNTQPIGSGPFRVVEIDSQHLLLKPDLRQFASPPYLDALEFRFFPDYPSILAAAEVGMVHGVSRILPEYLGQAEAIPNLQLFTTPLPGFTAVLFNLNSANAPFLAEKPVRQALAHATDRDRLLEEIILGVGMAGESPILPGTWAYTDDFRRYRFDLDRARAMLTEAGWVDADGDGVREKEGVKLEFIFLSDDTTNSVLISQSLVADWAQIGVRALPQTVSFTGMVSDFLAPRNYAAALVHWETIGDPDPYPLWHSSQTGSAGQNYSGWASRQADIAMEQARLISDRSQRQQYYATFQQTFAEDTPAIVLYYPLYTYGVAATVRQVQMGRLNQPAGRFDTFADWYMLTRKLTLSERRIPEFDNLPR